MLKTNNFSSVFFLFVFKFSVFMGMKKYFNLNYGGGLSINNLDQCNALILRHNIDHH